LQGLRENGYAEGQSITIEDRYFGDAPGPLGNAADDLVRLGVDVIVVMGTPAALAAKRATNSIPIVAASWLIPWPTALLSSPMFYVNYRRIVDLAARQRLPTMYYFREAVEGGGLMCYGADIPDLFRLTAKHVAKILKGAKPGDLPVEQPTKFEFLINLKTAKVLRVTIAPSLLARADEVFE
jgi:ABC-type uncharacterized transport system substrate-binding protein